MKNNWKINVLICPSCQSEDLAGDIPHIACARCGYELEFTESNILKTEIPTNSGIDFHEKMEKGTTLRELQDKYLHLAYWETPYYKHAIQHWLGSLIKEDWLALDVGAGDGRFTDYLIEMGVKKIVVTDSNIQSLESLSRYADEHDYRDKLLIIQSSARYMPLKKESADVILSIGVLYYLNEDFEEGLESTVSLLKKDGYIIDAEPDLEGSILKSFLFEGINSFLQTTKKKIFTETHAGIPYSFRTFGRDEIKEHYKKNKLTVLGYHGISLLPSLLSIGKIRGMLHEEEIHAKEIELRKAFDQCEQNGSIYKHIMWFCQK